MTNLETGSATTAVPKMKQKPKADCSASPIRVKQSTRSQLDDLLRRANKQALGRKVKTDDLISFSLSLVTDAHLEHICDKTLTNKDRLEMLFRRFSKERRGATREEFLGVLLEGKLTI